MIKLRHVILPFALAVITYSDFAHASDQTPGIEAFKHSWTAAALKLQSQIDLNTPLNEATILGTHNSYNSKAYEIPFLRYVDPNHTLSLYDQLEMSVRSLELDAHWTMTKHFSRDILLCHAQSNHLGCGLFDRPFPEGLQEIHDWLKANPNEVVIVYIERHLDGHEPRLAHELETYLNEFLYKPTQIRDKNAEPKSCLALPSTLTKADILKAGKQLVIVVKGCDGTNPDYQETDIYPEVWNDTVFAGIGKISTDNFTFIDQMMDEITPFPDCGKSAGFSPDIGHTSMWRVYEDRTMLTDVIHPGKQLLADDMRLLNQCDINWPTMDMLEVGDARLNAAVWSWAEPYPLADHGNCALYKAGVGIINAPCEQEAGGYACLEEKSHEITAVMTNGAWASGEKTCQLLAGNTWHFVTPVNGTQMRKLKESMANLPAVDLWLNYQLKAGTWIANSN